MGVCVCTRTYVLMYIHVNVYVHIWMCVSSAYMVGIDECGCSWVQIDWQILPLCRTTSLFSVSFGFFSFFVGHPRLGACRFACIPLCVQIFLFRQDDEMTLEQQISLLSAMLQANFHGGFWVQSPWFLKYEEGPSLLLSRLLPQSTLRTHGVQ